MLRTVLAAILAGALLGAPGFVAAQGGVPFAILDDERLLRDSGLGQQVLAGIRAAEQALEAENQQLFDQLAAEESALVEARPTMTPEAFREAADAFDRRVEEIRAERDQRGQDLARQSEIEVQRFFEAVLPVLVRLMNERGLVAILKPDTVIIGAEWLDITELAIERLDAAEPAASPDAARD